MTDRNAAIERAIRFIETGSHTQIARDTMTDELRKLLAHQVQADAGAVACKRCGAQTVAQCNDMNCHFLEAGNGGAAESDKMEKGNG